MKIVDIFRTVEDLLGEKVNEVFGVTCFSPHIVSWTPNFAFGAHFAGKSILLNLKRSIRPIHVRRTLVQENLNSYGKMPGVVHLGTSIASNKEYMPTFSCACGRRKAQNFLDVGNELLRSFDFSIF